MRTDISINKVNGIEIIKAESNHIRIEMVPGLGGKIISVYNKEMNKEFLWSNQDLALQLHEPGADYDHHFWGGIDELIPNDLIETIDGVSYPDHGELWTTFLRYEVIHEEIKVFGKLPLSQLYYEKSVSLDRDFPAIHINYRIVNQSGERRNFLWKLHAALIIKTGDKLVTSAGKARIVDPEYSRFSQTGEFSWPNIESKNASIVPGLNNTMDFFYLYHLQRGEMKLKNGTDGSLFAYIYDKEIFPYQWYFASYGKFFNHYVSILEPCSCMPMSVNEAKARNQCSSLGPGQEISTTVTIYAGEEKKYINNE